MLGEESDEQANSFELGQVSVREYPNEGAKASMMSPNWTTCGRFLAYGTGRIAAPAPASTSWNMAAVESTWMRTGCGSFRTMTSYSGNQARSRGIGRFPLFRGAGFWRFARIEHGVI